MLLKSFSLLTHSFYIKFYKNKTFSISFLSSASGTLLLLRHPPRLSSNPQIILLDNIQTHTHLCTHPPDTQCSETNKDFVSRSFAFFDCSVHESCFKCLKSQWNCNWCIYDNKCVFENSTCRNAANTITVENVSGLKRFFKINAQRIISF